MTQQEFMEKNDEIRMKHNIEAMAELLNLYEEYGKDSYSIDSIYNEIQDSILYTPKEIEYMKKSAIKEATRLKNN